MVETNVRVYSEGQQKDGTERQPFWNAVIANITLLHGSKPAHASSSRAPSKHTGNVNAIILLGIASFYSTTAL
eukprot:597530-Pelagomonas_calceolata.AAC.4